MSNWNHISLDNHEIVTSTNRYIIWHPHHKNNECYISYSACWWVIQHLLRALRNIGFFFFFFWPGDKWQLQRKNPSWSFKPQPFFPDLYFVSPDPDVKEITTTDNLYWKGSDKVNLVINRKEIWKLDSHVPIWRPCTRVGPHVLITLSSMECLFIKH